MPASSWRLVRNRRADRLHAEPQGRERHYRHLFLDGEAQLGLHQAERYHDLLEKTFLFLADKPKAARLRTEIRPPVRVYPIRSHLIIYALDECNEVFVIRVRHGREDWQGD